MDELQEGETDSQERMENEMNLSNRRKKKLKNLGMLNSVTGQSPRSQSVFRRISRSLSNELLSIIMIYRDCQRIHKAQRPLKFHENLRFTREAPFETERTR